MDSERSRPPELRNATTVESANPAVAQAEQTLRQLIKTGWAPSQVAEAVFDGIWNERFYILTHENWKPLVQKRMEDILRGRNPC